MAKDTGFGLAKLCEALGVERVSEVTRVVVDIRPGHVPMLYVERIGDAHKIVAALSEPGIELRREAAAKAVTHDGPRINGNVSGANIAWGNGNVTQNGR
ncbi:MAG: hypothetical protein V4515_14430 [Chloroflexota bacterium]